MSCIAVLGEPARVRGFALAGVDIIPAADRSEVLAGWEALDGDVGLLILTLAARRELQQRLDERPRLLWVVIAV